MYIATDTQQQEPAELNYSQHASVKPESSSSHGYAPEDIWGTCDMVSGQIGRTRALVAIVYHDGRPWSTSKDIRWSQRRARTRVGALPLIKSVLNTLRDG